ncbi:hypothetical protein V6Z11_D08G103500 [Gossypium hirsutum]
MADSAFPSAGPSLTSLFFSKVLPISLILFAIHQTWM